ncbi:hypothetical protein EBB07_06540 [Paenibacillaceae bacterium]|nr:hypothetical protein EBB07_06540 [Paenibacillaceae bacterium]
MKHKWLTYSVAAITAFSLLTGPVVTDIAAAAGKTTQQTQTKKVSQKRITLNGSASIVLKDAQFMMQDQGKVLTYTFTVTNNNSKTLDLTDYYFRLKSKSGKVYKFNSAEGDKAKTTVAPKSTQNLTYYAVVDNGVKLSDIQFEIVTWDFSVASFERKLGTIGYPFGFEEKVGAYKAGVVEVENYRIRSAVKKYTITEDKDNAYATIEFLVQNVGMKSVALSKLDFALQTDSLTIYDVDPTGLADIVVQPQERKIVTLKSTLPKAIVQKNLSVVIAAKNETANIKLPLGLFALPKPSKETVVQMNVQPFKAGVMTYEKGKIRGAIKQYTVSEDKDNAYVTINFLVQNSGQKSENLSKMKFTIQTASESVYDVHAGDLAQLVVQPDERKIVTMQATLPKSIIKKDLKLVASTVAEEKPAEGTTKPDKKTPPLANFIIPKVKPAASVEPGKTKLLYLNGQAVNTNTLPAYMTEEDEKDKLLMEFVFKNSSAVTIDLPALEFSVKTKNDVYYPLTYKNEGENKLLPNLEKKLELSGELPKGFDVASAELVVRMPKTEAGPGYLLSTYKLKAGTEESIEGGASTVFEYKKYAYRLQSVQRVPTTDDDLLTAELQITNKSDNYMSLPAVDGQFMINGVKIAAAETHKLNLNQVISLAPGESTNLIVYAKVPYFTTIGKLSFLLNEAQQDQKVKTLYQFTDATISAPQLVSTSTPYSIENKGRRAQLSISKSGVYDRNSDNDKVFYAEFTYENKETRGGMPTPLSAMLQAPNGQIIPVQLSEYKQSIPVQGKVLLSAWANIPKEFEEKDLKLIVGQTLTTTTPPSKPEGAPTTQIDGIVKAVSYRLPANDLSKTKTGDLTGIPYADYTLSLKNIYAGRESTGQTPEDMKQSGIFLNFKYDLIKKDESIVPAQPHKLVFEVVNLDKNKAVISKEVDTAAGSAGRLIEAKDGTYQLIIEDKEIASKFVVYNKYQLNIYDQLDEKTRVKIASKELRWFITES